MAHVKMIKGAANSYRNVVDWVSGGLRGRLSFIRWSFAACNAATNTRYAGIGL